ncbi:MAG: hypothetical protein Q9N34_06500 [Aquificota bacterium]|nr:hypothetical protein [Aquificota bacterium]
MFHVSRISPAFFAVSLLSLITAVVLKAFYGLTWAFILSASFGFIGSVLMGAIYQILPNSQNRPLRLPSLSYVVFLVYTSGLLLLSFGVREWGSIVLLLAVLVFAVHLTTALRNLAPVTVRLILLSVLCLLASAILLVLHSTGAEVPLRAVVHTLTVGAMLSAVYGVQMAWIPMLLMTALDLRKAMRVFYLKLVSTPLLVISLVAGKLVYVPALFEFVIAVYFLYIVYDLFKGRTSPAPVPPVVKLLVLGLIPLPFGLVIGLVMASSPQSAGYLTGLHTDLVVFGFGSFTVLGGVAHLTPRIVWMGWFAERGSVTLADLVDERATERFTYYGSLLYLLYLGLAQVPEPVSFLSTVPYFLLTGLYLRSVFVPVLKKLREVSHGAGKEAGERL